MGDEGMKDEDVQLIVVVIELFIVVVVVDDVDEDKVDLVMEEEEELENPESDLFVLQSISLVLIDEFSLLNS
jgi:hypothetical protein